MPSARRLAVPLAVALLAVLMTAAPVQAAPPGKAMVRKINSFRAAHGLPKLRSSGVLARSAAFRSRLMIARDQFVHLGPGEASRRFRLLGEVLELHRGRRARVGPAVRSWANSAPHRALLLNPAMRYVGAGRATGRFNGGVKTIWVVRLGGR